MPIVQFCVKGSVQGVGFRLFVQTSAAMSGLTGEVWNGRDGTVRGVASGDGIDEFIEVLWKGPGRVDAVTHEVAPERQYPDFSIVADR